MPGGRRTVALEAVDPALHRMALLVVTACWWARATVESTETSQEIKPSASGWAWSRSKMRCQVLLPKGGQMPKHGEEFVFGDPATWGEEQVVTVTDTRLYGKATARAWDRLHPRPTQRAAWLDQDGQLPLIEGTVIRPAAPVLRRGQQAGLAVVVAHRGHPGRRRLLLAGVPAQVRH